MSPKIILDKSQFPQHIAFIVDGNRRWAKKNKLLSTQGHKKGSDTVLRVIEDCLQLGIPVLTFYIFSTENWKRKEKEVNFIMKFGTNFLKKKIDYFHSKNIKVRFIGRIHELEGNLKKAIDYAEETTKNNDKMVVNLAVNYGGRKEIVDAVNKILENKDIKKVDEETISENLYTAGLPDPDLLIRTGGDFRISNYLLWQMAYTEIVIIPELWPDLSKEKLHEAITEYQRRQRRWGK
ncbi:MAG: di-trans,poly-cis-decaprenylcistransferase [Candidatus Omnitrophica bacterium]|nr:di-trans,poly-cis-decaprenylcistransferase [Candidatus Omnitrophota bacterium]MBU1047827.1 di-trans,poly-cis-decaprenylcistransferase [Candidatus Omnitrophota bacterium]MBU1631102.1 di-trans,poly-cis-decaprenylcistransferase [Candidatus Omnitrophota bacterium]MBU1889214.1 di-trans,poly-cis-decaprenylcistransferase [Candidatus Omnitrophota bacterium]